MSFVFSKLTDTATFSTDPDAQIPSGAFAWPLFTNMVSPSGHYVVDGDYYDIWTLTDTSIPAKIWSARLTHQSYLDALGDTITGFDCKAVDDDGDMWGGSSLADGLLVTVPKATHTPAVAFSWAGTGGDASELSVGSRTLTFRMPDNSIFILMVPAFTGVMGNAWIATYYTATKGVGTTLAQHTTGGTWEVDWAFQDDNGDIWIAGTDRAPGAVAALYVQRITDVAASTYPLTLQTFVMPSVDNSVALGGYSRVYPQGIFSGGYFLGGWGAGTDAFAATYLFRAKLDGTMAVTTRDVSADPVYLYFQQFNANPGHWFVQKLSTFNGQPPAGRVFTEIDKTTLAETGTAYDLDQWAANDIGDGALPEIVRTGVYLDYLPGFAGTRWFYTDAPPYLQQQTDLFIYYFGAGTGGGGGGDGLSDESLTLRVWGYSLDGHDFYVLRLGPSESLVLDLSTGQWASWASPGRNNWRAHVGQNWIGMSSVTLARGFGTDVVAGDDASGVLWILDPTTGRDDLTTTGSDPFTRRVTGGIQLTGRDVMPCNAVTIDLALGSPSQTGASLTLETSDDLAQTWLYHGSVTITAGDYSPVVEFRSLGLMKAPGRVFRLTDDGATVRLSGANLR